MKEQVLGKNMYHHKKFKIQICLRLLCSIFAATNWTSIKDERLSISYLNCLNLDDGRLDTAIGHRPIV